jgi:tetratricopeptide (TPR) repeat protein
MTLRELRLREGGLPQFRAFWLAICLLLPLLAGAQPAESQSPQTPSTNSVRTVFDLLITGGRAALREGKPDIALTSALAAIKEDEKRFEGYALAGMACQKKGEIGKASEYFDHAIERSPESKRAQLALMKQSLSNTNVVASAAPSAPSEALSSEAKVKLKVLELIARDADKKDVPAEEHQRYLSEYLDKSAEFLKDNPDCLPVWEVRAAMALELNRPHESWEAGRNLKRLTAGKSELAQVTELLAMLERKGWLGEKAPEAITSATVAAAWS